MGMYYRVMDEEDNIVYEGEWWDEAMSYVKAVAAGGFVSVLAWDQHYNPKTLMEVFEDEPPARKDLKSLIDLIDPPNFSLLTKLFGEED